MTGLSILSQRSALCTLPALCDFIRTASPTVPEVYVAAQRSKAMNRRDVLSLSAMTAVACAFLPSNAGAQQGGDVEGVKGASKDFYGALNMLDNGEAMEKVWAHTPYVTYVGPRAKSTIIVGWDALKKYW